MTFKDLKEEYPYREPAFSSGWSEPNEEHLMDLIEKYKCKYPRSFIEFQMRYCKEVPMGDIAFNGFGFANKDLEPYMNLEEVLKSYSTLEYPKYLTPFREDNGDFWCFDNRSADSEYPVVIFDHNSNGIEVDPEFKWQNFMDWLDKTMVE